MIAKASGRRDNFWGIWLRSDAWGCVKSAKKADVSSKDARHCVEQGRDAVYVWREEVREAQGRVTLYIKSSAKIWLPRYTVTGIHRNGAYRLRMEKVIRACTYGLVM